MLTKNNVAKINNIQETSNVCHGFFNALSVLIRSKMSENE